MANFRLVPGTNPGQHHVIREVTYAHDATRSGFTRLIADQEAQIEAWQDEIRKAQARISEMQQARDLFPEAGA